ncbi:uncharacterized protein LOC124461765 [Drosophila willistoni]|uniref:uncharacterized protein LOC124461765 n=1 Tax=Drosophila willistoni TaxID=7260 RepID=UPI001F071D2C|nr:uncharacterized protein LOC124461765 [Drosophila willistoni]
MVVKSTLSPGHGHDPQNVSLHDSAVCCDGGAGPNELVDFPVGVGTAPITAAAAAAAHAGSMGSRESLLLANEAVAAAHHPSAGQGGSGGVAAGPGHHSGMLVHPSMHPAMHPSIHHHRHHGGSHAPPQYANQKTRMRTSFDPEMELPKLQKWFQENPHSSRQQIQNYVVQLNALESRRGRKPLDVNNVVYWFKNARAAQKRAEMRGNVTTTMSAMGHAAMNGYLSQHHGAQLGQNSSSSAGSQPSMIMGNLSGMSHDYLKSPMSLKSEDIDTMFQHSDDMDEEVPVSRLNTLQLPLSLTTHERNRNFPLMDGDEKHDDDEATAPIDVNGNVHEDERQQQQQQEKSNDEHKDDISKEHTEGGHNEQDHEQLPDDSALNHNNNENELTTPKNHPRMQPNALTGAGLNGSSISNEERRKRNRTFIDPVTEAPKLEQWFAMNTHPSHNLILKYTEDLNTMPYS